MARLSRSKPLKAKKGLKPGKGSKKPDKPTLDRLIASGKVWKASAALSAGKGFSKKRKTTGEWAFFMDIWAQRPHRCQICTAAIDEPKPINFSHVLPKGTYRRLRLDPQNIFIKCASCHRRWHDFGHELRTSWAWHGFFETYDRLKKEAHAQ